LDTYLLLFNNDIKLQKLIIILNLFNAQQYIMLKTVLHKYIVNNINNFKNAFNSWKFEIHRVK